MSDGTSYLDEKIVYQYSASLLCDIPENHQLVLKSCLVPGCGGGDEIIIQSSRYDQMITTNILQD